MFIKKIGIEDLSMLDLLVSKLEENMKLYGINFFRNAREESSISRVYENSHENEDFNRSGSFEMIDESCIARPLMRAKIMFDSKGDFANRFDMDLRTIADDGIFISSYLHIEWDYFTSVFEINIGTNEYEKEKNNLSQKRVYRSNTKSSVIEIDFGFEYRREIQLIKIRLGKLYSGLIRDTAAERDAFVRKGFTEAAMAAFPDILDPLILGGSLNEKRDDRGVSGEGRDSSKDASTDQCGDAKPNQSI